MSAAEKLKTLQADQLREGRFPTFPGDEVLLAALPQIVAVVERLEWCADAFDYISGMDVAGWDAHVPTEVVAIGAKQQVELALAALDETLA